MSNINVYRITKRIYQNYVIVFHNSKTKGHLKVVGIDKYIVLYIKNHNNNIYSLKDYVNYFKNKKISYIVIKEGDIIQIEKFDNYVYLDYYYKSIIFQILNTIKYRVCM